MIVKLLATNIYDHLVLIGKGESDARSWYYWNSKLFKAIQKHIATAEDCVVINRPKNSIVSYRGTGPAIQLRSVKACPYGMWSTRQIEYKIAIEYWTDEIGTITCRTEEPLSSGESSIRNYSILTPADLELDFSQKAFDDWIDKLKIEREEEAKKHRKWIVKEKGKKETFAEIYGAFSVDEVLEEVKEQFPKKKNLVIAPDWKRTNED